MQVRVKKTNKDGMVRLESGGDIREILIHEDIMHPEKESVNLCFRGKHSSGIVSLSPEEIERLSEAVKGKTGLVKTVEVGGI
ncbi:TPA: hypothetical protein HA361_01150 [Candidatus Woesearchaeota archaeon]|nr:hypothetical protein [Candidatus Woesearchaeota archaeon]HII68897.1 hypothetical protein [Candidatus Woesearchaeota archaeon]